MIRLYISLWLFFHRQSARTPETKLPESYKNATFVVSHRRRDSLLVFKLPGINISRRRRLSFACSHGCARSTQNQFRWWTEAAIVARRCSRKRVASYVSVDSHRAAVSASPRSAATARSSLTKPRTCSGLLELPPRRRRDDTSRRLRRLPRRFGERTEHHVC